MKQFKEIMLIILLPVIFVFIIFELLFTLHRPVKLEKCIFDDFKSEKCIKLKQEIKSKYIKVEEMERK